MFAGTSSSISETGPNAAFPCGVSTKAGARRSLTGREDVLGGDGQSVRIGVDDLFPAADGVPQVVDGLRQREGLRPELRSDAPGVNTTAPFRLADQHGDARTVRFGQSNGVDLILAVL